jgi:NSS family neurotransmitter:Na+ symporter
MTESRQSIHGQWSSRWAFILAATGSAVGLGNIWKFPYITGENGGGAFVLVYLLCIAVVGIPVMMSEIMLGRRGKQSPIHTMRTLAQEERAGGYWQLVGWFGVLSGFLILSFYSVIAGWALSYVVEALSGTFTEISGDQSGELFTGLVSNPGTQLFWHTLFMAMTMFIVARGVREGLERAVRLLMPVLFVLLLILVGYAMNSGGFTQGLHFLFDPDFSKITTEGVLTALGHAFFTLSLGMGAIMIYGAYLPDDVSITRVTMTVALADTVVALLSGMAIFPQTLPVAFGAMPGGVLFGTLFFVLLVFAAWSSAISIIEPVVAWLVETKGWSRNRAALGAGLVTWVLGIATVLSFNLWSEIKWFDKTIFDLLDYLTANILLPLGGLLIALFAGWVMNQNHSKGELGLEDTDYRRWQFLIRFVTPVAIVLVFLNAVELI